VSLRVIGTSPPRDESRFGGFAPWKGSEAREATGWELRVADDLGETDAPTKTELEALRSLQTKGSGS